MILIRIDNSLYRYRLVKRHASKLNQKQTPKLDPNTDLQPILEHVQMNFTSPTHQKTVDVIATVIESMNKEHSTLESQPIKVSDSDQSSATATTCDMTNNSSTSSSKEKNYHIMSQYELMAHLNEYRQQKRNLRSVLRTFENDFYKKTGRHVEKEDRSNMSSVYASYKVFYIIYKFIFNLSLFFLHFFLDDQRKNQINRSIDIEKMPKQ